MKLPHALGCLGLLLTACATAPLLEEFVDSAPLASWEQARQEPACVVLLCVDDGCALWRCRDTQAAQAQAWVVPTRGPLVLRPPSFTTPSRWWGHPLAVPTYAEPVFEIPWHNWKQRDRPLAKVPVFCIPSQEPVERHHIFPQEMVEWFKDRGGSIHDFTLPLPSSFHRWLHSEGPRGGQWNEAWRQFIVANQNASPSEIWRFAGELMTRFHVMGEFMRYCH